MPGLEELGLFQNLTGQQGESPLGTLTALKALRAEQMPGITKPQSSVNQGSPFKTTQVDMPDLSGGNVDAAMEQGAKRAEREASSKTGGGDHKFNPMLVDLAREMAPTDDDRNSALVKGGIGMALAGGQTGNFLTALAAGLGQGTDHFDRLRAQRAERALKEGELNSNINHRQGMLGNAQRQTDIEGTKAEAMGRYYDNQGRLIPSQIDENEAKAASARAQAGYYGARSKELSSGPEGIPTKIWRDSVKAAEISLRGGAFESEEAREMAVYQRAMALARTAAGGGPPGSEETPSDPNTPAAPTTTPWRQGKFAVTPEKDASIPLLGNPAVFVPLNQVKTALAKGTFGAYDPGQAFNMGVNQLNFLKNEAQQVFKVGGHQLATVMKNIDGMMPKQGVLVSSAQNYDKLKSLADDVYMKMKQDSETAIDNNVSKALRDEAGKRLQIEKRMLEALSGSKSLDQWERFDSEKPSAKTAPVDDEMKGIMDLYRPKTP